MKTLPLKLFVLERPSQPAVESKLSIALQNVLGLTPQQAKEATERVIDNFEHGPQRTVNEVELAQVPEDQCELLGLRLASEGFTIRLPEIPNSKIVHRVTHSKLWTPSQAQLPLELLGFKEPTLTGTWVPFAPTGMPITGQVEVRAVHCYQAMPLSVEGKLITSPGPEALGYEEHVEHVTVTTYLCADGRTWQPYQIVWRKAGTT